MARVYKIEVIRDSNPAVMYYHNDGTLELEDPDSGGHITYLQDKLVIADLLFKWMSKHDVESFECVKV